MHKTDAWHLIGMVISFYEQAGSNSWCSHATFVSMAYIIYS